MVRLTGDKDERRVWRTVVVPVTSALDGFEHLVAEDAIAPNNASRYVALCGRDVWAAALAAPPGPRCLACLTVHNAEAADGPRHRRPTRSRAWARLTGLLRRPTSGTARVIPVPDVTLPPTGTAPSPLHQSVRQ